MSKVQIKITKIADESFPVWLSFELEDINGVIHTFEEKEPVLLPDNEAIPSSFPIHTSIDCEIIEKASDFVLIDTSQPHGIFDLNGESLFKVSPSLLVKTPESSLKQIELKFSQGMCRIESGIFLNTDEAYRIHFDKDKGYYAGDIEPLSALIEENGDDWWAEIDPHAKSSFGDLIAYAGDGSYEGEGYVALTRFGKLEWIIHMERSEIFNQVEIVDGFVIANAKHFDHKNTLTIPIDSPNNFIFTLGGS